MQPLGIEPTASCFSCRYSTDLKQLNIYLRVLAKSSRVCITYSAHKRKYYAHSYTRVSCEYRVYAYIVSGSTCTIRVCMELTDHRTHARAHLYTTCEYSYATRDCCIDHSQALTRGLSRIANNSPGTSPNPTPSPSPILILGHPGTSQGT